YLHAFTATNAIFHRLTLCFKCGHDQDSRGTFCDGNINRCQCLAHHGATTDHLAGTLGYSPGSIDQCREGGPNAGTQVAGALHLLACDSYYPLYKRFVFLHCLVDGKEGTHVLHYCPHRNGERPGGYLTTGQRVDQLFLASLWVLHFQWLYLDARIGFYFLCEESHCILLV